jgi:hypothetical protein
LDGPAPPGGVGPFIAQEAEPGGNAVRAVGVDWSDAQHLGALTRDLRTQLQSAAGNTYAIERELGGGVMPQVFLATEARLRHPLPL